MFAETVQNVTVKNAAAKGLIEKLNRSYDEATDMWYFPDITAVRIIFKDTPKESLAKKLLVDIYACYGGDITLQDMDEGEFPFEFIYQLARRLMNKHDLDQDGIVVRKYLGEPEVKCKYSLLQQYTPLASH